MKDNKKSLQQQIDELNLTVIALQEDIEYLSLSLSKLENTSPNEISRKLLNLEIASPNPYGDDDFATPNDK